MVQAYGYSGATRMYQGGRHHPIISHPYFIWGDPIALLCHPRSLPPLLLIGGRRGTAGLAGLPLPLALSCCGGPARVFT